MTLGGARGSEESLELDVLRSSKEVHHHHHPPPPPPTTTTTTTTQGSSSLTQPAPGLASVAAASRGHHRGNHHRSTSSHHHSHSHQGAGGAAQPQPLQSSGSAHNIRDWPGGGSREDCRPDCRPDCVSCARPPHRSQRSLDLDTSPRDAGKHRKKLERMYSEDKTSTEDRGETGGGGLIKMDGWIEHTDGGIIRRGGVK